MGSVHQETGAFSNTWTLERWRFISSGSWSWKTPVFQRTRTGWVAPDLQAVGLSIAMGDPQARWLVYDGKSMENLLGYLDI
jgi:hypothetical protein